MDERTGKIAAIDELTRRMHDGTAEERLRAIQESENYVEIPAAKLPEVQGMNRHERRKWAALQRHKQRAAAKRTAKTGA